LKKEGRVTSPQTATSQVSGRITLHQIKTELEKKSVADFYEKIPSVVDVEVGRTIRFGSSLDNVG
jgi:hypothetical protein